MPHVQERGQPEMKILTPQQLTGRERSHVVEVPQLQCSLHPAAAAALMSMMRDAAGSGLDIAPLSGFRDFNQQLVIWNGKFRGERALLDRDGAPLNVATMQEEQIVRAILHWSALPAASRHHWGTEIDVFDRAVMPQGARPRLVPSEYGCDGIFAALSAWLARHAERYGFYLPYDSDRGGVQPEPWHLSFAPLSSVLLPELTVALLAETLAGVALAGASIVQRLLPEIHARYVCAVAAPSARALRAESVDAG